MMMKQGRFLGGEELGENDVFFLGVGVLRKGGWEGRILTRFIWANYVNDP